MSRPYSSEPAKLKKPKSGTGTSGSMFGDKRKSTRQPIRYSAWIALPNKKLLGCALADISDHGARLDVESTENIPDKFVLLLSNRGRPKRKCKVAWRNEHQLGVEFERPLAHPDKNKAVRKLAAQAAPPIAPPPEPEAVDDKSESEPA
jgi:hypothetical protein